MSQWTMLYNTSISYVATEKTKLAITSDKRTRGPGLAITEGASGCCTAGASDAFISRPNGSLADAVVAESGAAMEACTLIVPGRRRGCTLRWDLGGGWFQGGLARR